MGTGDSDRILTVFAKAAVDGLDFSDGIERFGGNSKLYVRIIKTFVDNIGKHLDVLAKLSPGELEAYGIEIHGVKGSCYGISANKEGNMAKELEMAAKAGDYDRIAIDNVIFIRAMNELTKKLHAVLDEIEGCGVGVAVKKPEPDREVLDSMLQASRDFDLAGMHDALKKLEQFEYDSGGDLVKWLGEQVIVFGYDRIVERLMAVLNRSENNK